MKKWMKILGSLFILAVLAALYVWFFVYNKPHRDIEKADPDHIVAAEELYFQYRNDISRADSLYTGKVLQITGPINKVETHGDSMVIAVFAFDQGMFGDLGIRCVMLPIHYKGLGAYNKGSTITLKGLCTGYNTDDVIIEKSSIVVDK